MTNLAVGICVLLILWGLVRLLEEHMRYLREKERRRRYENFWRWVRSSKKKDQGVLLHALRAMRYPDWDARGPWENP
jgi:heme exporter protein D